MRLTAALALVCCAVLTPWVAAAADTPPREPRARTIQECATLQRDAPESYEPYQCYWAMARQQAQTDAALQQLDALITLNPVNYKARLYRGVIGCDNSLARGPEDVRTAIAGAASAADRRGEVYGWITLVFWGRQHGDNEMCLEALSHADAAATLSGAEDLLRMVRVQRAWQSYRAGEFAMAYAAFRRMVDELDDQPLNVTTWELVDGLAASAWSMYRYDEAIAAYRRVEEYLHARGARYQEANLTVNLISVLGFAGASPAELELETDKLFALSESSGNSWIRPAAIRLSAHYLPPHQAREKYRQALALATEPDRREEIVKSTLALGESWLTKAPLDETKGLALLDRAVDLARSRGSRALWISARVYRARTLWSARRFDLARSESLGVLAEFDRSRELLSDTIRARTFARWGDVYRGVVAQFLFNAPEAGQPDSDLAEAFQVLERLRSRDLLERLEEPPRTLNAQQQQLEQQRVRLVDQITQVQKQLIAPDTADSERQAALEQLEHLEAEELEVRDRVTRAGPQGLPGAVDFVSLNELQAALAPDQALLSYSISTQYDGESASWLIAVTRGSAHAYRLPPRHRIDRGVRFFLGMIERRDGAERSGSQRLYDDLIAPALAEFPAEIRELLIVPDATLHTLPFALLRAGQSQPSLGQRFAITTIPSATVWLRAVRSAPLPTNDGVLVLADPDLPSGEARPSLSRDWSSLGAIGLGALPYARSEARGLSEAVADSEIRVGADASERFIKQADLSHYGIVHLAAHALIDIDAPERSAVLLSPGNDREDGLLQPREIAELNLRGRVVVLSACRSAGGMLLPGEGPVGLSHAFFKAGARAVIGSLWPVRDDDAERLIRGFYAHLAEGQSLTAAMSHARSERETAGAPASAWAGFVVIGDGDYVPFLGGARGSFPRWGWLLLALVAGTAGLVLRRRR